MSSHLSIGDVSSGNLQTQTILSRDEDQDSEDETKYLKLQLKQLRRQNKDLRKMLEKYRIRMDGEKSSKAKKQYAILKHENPFVELIKELAASQQVIEAFGQNNRIPDFKIPTVQSIPKQYSSDALTSKIEGLIAKEDSYKVTCLIDILQEQHNQRIQFDGQLEQFLQQIVDVVRRITKQFTTKSIKMRKLYTKIKGKTTLFKLQYQKYKMDINLLLRDMEKHIQRKMDDPMCKDEDPLHLMVSRPSFRYDHGKKNSVLTADVCQKQVPKKDQNMKK